MTSNSPEERDTLSTSPPEGFRGFIRRISTSGQRPQMNQEAVDRLVAMGFPAGPAARQLQMSGGDERKAAEYLVHAAHPKPPGDEWNHPECPVCVREAENVRVAHLNAPSLTNMLGRIRSRNSDEGDKEPHEQPRRGSVSAMLRRPSISAALARMTTRDVDPK